MSGSRPDAPPFSVRYRTLAVAETLRPHISGLPQPPDCGSKTEAGASGTTPNFRNCHMWLNGRKPLNQHPNNPRNRREKAFQTKFEMPPPASFLLTPSKGAFSFRRNQMGHPTKAQRSGFCGEEESGEAPPAAEKASRFRGSGAIGGPEGAGNRNAATVCKGATERYEGCPPPQGVPNIAQFAPTTDGGFEAAAFAAPSRAREIINISRSRGLR